jgi:hypothetical protein
MFSQYLTNIVCRVGTKVKVKKLDRIAGITFSHLRHMVLQSEANLLFSVLHNPIKVCGGNNVNKIVMR